MPILCQNAFTKSLFFQHGFDHPPTPPLLNNVKKTARLVKRHIPNYSPLPCSTRLSKLLLRGNPGGSLALQHPLKIRSEPTISYLFCLSNLECGDGDPTLPIVEVGHRPIDGEGEAHQGHQGPHQSVHQGQGPVDRFTLRKIRLEESFQFPSTHIGGWQNMPILFKLWFLDVQLQKSK